MPHAMSHLLFALLLDFSVLINRWYLVFVMLIASHRFFSKEDRMVGAGQGNHKQG